MWFKVLTLLLLVSISNTLTDTLTTNDNNRFQKIKNVYDDYSDRLRGYKLKTSTTGYGMAAAKTNNGITVYEPREDPKLFYKSEEYLQNYKTSLDDNYVIKNTSRYMANNLKETSKDCINCPSDVILLAEPGSNVIVFKPPKLKSCSQQFNRKLRFIKTHGPNYGSQLPEGRHFVVGKIVQGRKIIQHCRYKVEVFVHKTCQLPSYLKMACDSTSRCYFQCLNNDSTELIGHKSLHCNKNLKWSDELPTCQKSNSWCQVPNAPKYGKIMCVGSQVGYSFKEGSRCRVRCQPGYHALSQSVTFCRSGRWSKTDFRCIKRKTQNNSHKYNETI